MVHVHAVYVLKLDHRFGTDMYVKPSYEEAIEVLLGHVEGNWDRLVVYSDGDVPAVAPEDEDLAIELYFEHARNWEYGEYYEIEEHQITFK